MLDREKIEKMTLELATLLDEYAGGDGKATTEVRLNQMVAVRLLYRAMESQVGPMISAIVDTVSQLMEVSVGCDCPECTERRAETQRREVKSFLERTQDSFVDMDDLMKAGLVSKKGEA